MPEPRLPDLMADMPTPMEFAIESTSKCFDVYEKLGSGSFGAVYRVRRRPDGKEFAMKCESIHARKKVLRFEAKVMIEAMRINSHHMLHYVDRGTVRGKFLYIVMRLLGKNLWDLRLEQPGRQFPMSTVIKIAEQTLAAIRDLHRTGYLHRDIKPPNFSIGRKEDQTFHTIYLLDYGLCRCFRSETKDLRLPRDLAAFRGTTRYASINTLEKREQSRKDDIESWWYQTVELMTSNLPWRHCKGADRILVRDYKVNLRKSSIYMTRLLQKTPAEQMRAILAYVDGLEYNSIPDYDYIHRELMAGAKVFRVNMAEPPSWDDQQPYMGPRYETGLDFNPKGSAEDN